MKIPQYMKVKQGSFIFFIILSQFFLSSCSTLKSHNRTDYDESMSIFPKSNKIITREVHRILKNDKENYSTYLYHPVSLTIYCDTVDGRILKIDDDMILLVDHKFVPFHNTILDYVKKFSHIKIQ